MNKVNIVIMGLCFIIFIQQLVISSKEEHFNVNSSYNSFPTYEDKVIIGDKAIKKEHLEKLIVIIGSNEKTMALADRFGIEVEQAPPEIATTYTKKQVIYDVMSWKHSTSGGTQEFSNSVFKEILEELENFFRKYPEFAYKALRCYQRNKSDKQFWDKVEQFIENN
jgi:hypothetical protein